jgi:hypothetical protein
MVLPDLANGEATREYSPDQFANLLRSARELASRQATPETKSSEVDAAKQNGPTGDTTRVYSPDEFSCLVSSVHALTASATPLQTPANDPRDSEQRASNVENDRSLVGVATTQVIKRVRRRSNRRVGALLSACLLACAGLLGVAFTSQKIPGQRLLASRLVPRESVVMPDTPNNLTASQPSRLIRLSVEIEPPESLLFVDGESASNPLQLAYPNDGRVHEIRGEAPGYLTRTTSLRFDRDVLVVLSLEKASADEPATVE